MKKKIRTDLQLVEITLKELKTRGLSGHYGLCGFIFKLYKMNKITSIEHDILDKIIDNFEPPSNGDAYYFEPGEVKPRIEFLKMIINKLKEKENVKQKRQKPITKRTRRINRST